jgi:hypothetical protein
MVWPDEIVPAARLDDARAGNYFHPCMHLIDEQCGTHAFMNGNDNLARSYIGPDVSIFEDLPFPKKFTSAHPTTTSLGEEL